MSSAISEVDAQTSTGVAPVAAISDLHVTFGSPAPSNSQDAPSFALRSTAASHPTTIVEGVVLLFAVTVDALVRRAQRRSGR